MNELLEILEDINPGIDYETCTDLVTGGHYDSIAILGLVSELEDAFDVEISAAELIPENFDSAQALWAMICRLADE